MSALHEAARRVVSAWVSTRPAWIEQCNAAVMALDAALKTQPEPAQEPVAWWMPQHLRHQGKSFTSWVKDGHEKPPIYFGWVPLYTTPQPQRPALTDEEIDRLWHDNGAGIDAERFARIARAVERKVRGEA